MLEELNNKQVQCKSRAEFNYAQELLFKNGFKWRHGETYVLDYYSNERDMFIRIRNGTLSYNTGLKGTTYDEIDYDFLIDILSNDITFDIGRKFYIYLKQVKPIRGLSLLKDEDFILELNTYLLQIKSDDVKKAIANWLFCEGEWLFEVKSTYYLYNYDDDIYFKFDIFDAPSSTSDENMKQVFYDREEAEKFESKYWELREEY